MIIIRDLKNIPPKGFERIVLTLGAFDGVHRGHKKILSKVRRDALRMKCRSAVLTFREHPQVVLNPSAPKLLLTSYRHKLALIASEKIDICFVPHFSEALSGMGAEDFVRKILVGKMRVRKVVLGHDARFGKGREGDIVRMQAFAKKYGFLFSVVRELKYNGRPVKSTRVRQDVTAGHLSEARKLLGRPFSVLTEVIHGDHRGRKLGFPTANLLLQNEILPPFGVYAVCLSETNIRWSQGGKMPEAIRFGKASRKWRGVMNWGIRPTFAHEAGNAVAEVHLPGFSGNLYGKRVEVEFLEKIREEKRFKGPEELNREIQRDIARAKKVFEKK